MPNLTNFGKLAGMTFQVMQPTKMDFAGVEATRMMHNFKFEPNWSSLRYLADLPKKGQNHQLWGRKKYPCTRVQALKKIWHGVLALKIHLKLFSSPSRHFPGVKTADEKVQFYSEKDFKWPLKSFGTLWMASGSSKWPPRLFMTSQPFARVMWTCM